MVECLFTNKVVVGSNLVAIPKNNLFFLGVEIIWKQGTFTITIYQKLTFSGIYSNFESFLPTVCKLGNLAYRCFCIFSSRAKFHDELTLFKIIFCKNGYPGNLYIDKCFKKFLNSTHLVKENLPTVEKKYLFLVLPYL